MWIFPVKVGKGSVYTDICRIVIGLIVHCWLQYNCSLTKAKCIAGTILMATLYVFFSLNQKKLLFSSFKPVYILQILFFKIISVLLPYSETKLFATSDLPPVMTWNKLWFHWTSSVKSYRFQKNEKTLNITQYQYAKGNKLLKVIDLFDQPENIMIGLVLLHIRLHGKTTELRNAIRLAHQQCKSMVLRLEHLADRG